MDGQIDGLLAIRIPGGRFLARRPVTNKTYNTESRINVKATADFDMVV